MLFHGRKRGQCASLDIPLIRVGRCGGRAFSGGG